MIVSKMDTNMEYQKPSLKNKLGFSLGKNGSRNRFQTSIKGLLLLILLRWQVHDILVPNCVQISILIFFLASHKCTSSNLNVLFILCTMKSSHRASFGSKYRYLVNFVIRSIKLLKSWIHSSSHSYHRSCFEWYVCFYVVYISFTVFQ